MKKLVTIIILCLGCIGILGAQNIWKPINGTGIIGVGPDGSLFAYSDYGALSRSQDEGDSWQIVLGQETGFNGFVNHSCFAVSNEGRIYVINDNQQTVMYSDDNGDTWHQTTSFSPYCAFPTKTGICAPTNDLFVVWAKEGEIHFTFDGGETWDGWVLSFLENSESVSDLLVNENGDVYVSVAYYIMNIVGIYHSTLSDIQNWELVAFEGISIKDMAFDPEGNVVACGYNADGSSVGFQHIPGFYLFDGTSLAIGDGGVVYTPHFTSHSAILSYSFSYDHGEHFTEIGEEIPLVDIAPGGENARLFKGADNQLYFDGGGEYWKSIRDADHIPSYDYYPLIEEANNRQKWNVVYIGANENYPNDYFTEIQSIRDNITLDGVDYKLVWRESVHESKRNAGAVREEDKRVYFRRYWQQSYQDEVLLYDFNLSVGDTVSVGWSDYQLIVLEESQVQVNGTMRRQLGLAMYFADGTTGEIEEYWIEGVGSTYGFLNSGYEGWVGAFVHLLCYHENGNLIWDNEEFDDCVMNSDGAPATFAPQGAEWYFDVFNPWGTHPEYERFFVEGDTIIQGYQCSIINQHFVDTGHEGGEFVYEEDDKVYWFNPTTNAFTTLYDFDAEAGESWYYEVGECTHQVTVDSVGSMTWNGHTYRTQWVRFNEPLPAYRGKIIEGIGYERGLFPSIYVCDGLEVFDAREIEYLRCYVKDDAILYHEGDYDCDAIGNTGDDDMLNAYCEAPFNFGGSPIADQGAYGAQLWWNKPFASHWFHYDERPYAGSAEAFKWGIRIPGEEIHAGDMLTHVAFYRAGCQNEAEQYDFAFSGGETEPENLEFLAWNSVVVEPGPDEWVMVELRYPIVCEEGRSLWIVMRAPFIAGNKAPYCQTSGNPDARWVNLIGGWYDYLAEEGTGGDWMIRGYFTNDIGYNDPGYNENLDHYNIYRGSSLDELEKIAEVGRDEEEYFDTLQSPFGDYYYQLTASYTDGRESAPAKRSENPHSPDYVYFHVGNMSSLGSEWYYEILNENGGITYQHLEYAADTTVNHKDVKIIIRTNTLYDKKGEHSEVTREYIYEDFGKVYWWNERLQDFTMLYNLGAQPGDSWVIKVGTDSITMQVDTVEQMEYEGTTYRMLTVSDENNLFSGEIISGIGHLTSFFPERLMTRGMNYRVEGIRCYWREGELVFKYGNRDCDEVYQEYHNGIEEDDPSTGSGTLTVYPNPTHGVLNVRLPQYDSPTGYRITNLMGQTLMSGNITTDVQRIDVSNLSEGMYFISIGDTTRKFVVR